MSSRRSHLEHRFEEEDGVAEQEEAEEEDSYRILETLIQGNLILIISLLTMALQLISK